MVRDLLGGTEKVLDVGTVGGEKLVQLADAFGSATGIDIDPEMVETARQNLPVELLGRIDFRNGTARSTGMQDSSVEVVLNRHSVVDVPEIARVLRPGGLFISQHVGERNLAAVVSPFGGQKFDGDQHPEIVRDSFLSNGFKVERFEEYDVDYEFLDLESLFFQIKAIGAYPPVELKFEHIAEALLRVVTGTATPVGRYRSNEHRWLTVARAG